MRLTGIGVTDSIAVGTAKVMRTYEREREARQTGDIREESVLLESAAEQSKEQLKLLIEHAVPEAGQILSSHLHLLEDPEFLGAAAEAIRTEGITAVCAVQKTADELRELFLSFDDAPYMRERAADIEDVAKRLISNLTGAASEELSSLPANTVVVAHDLVPSQTAQLDRGNTMGFVTEVGGRTSHTAIMANCMQISAVVGCSGALSGIRDGDVLVVDAAQGVVIVNPNEDELAEYRRMAEKREEQLQELKRAKHARIYCGQRRIRVAANIGSPDEALRAKEQGADGVGLFRTEFLYLDREDCPGEEEQFEAYRQVAATFRGDPVIVRTLDIGGDKRLTYLAMPEEENPFLGVRGIRLCLANEALFKIQLRAILRASVYGDLSIMFPMVSGLQELQCAHALLETCKKELDRERRPYCGRIPVGIMIEVPAAALCAEQLAPHVDFFSIGTNDLTQYTLAADRGNAALNSLYDYCHPGVLTLIRMTIEAAHRHGIPCGMCGEMAADKTAVPLLAEYGLDEYSVSCGRIGQTKYALSRQSGNRAVLEKGPGED